MSVCFYYKHLCMYLHANKIKSDYSLKSYNQIIINTSILKFNRDCPPHANKVCSLWGSWRYIKRR